ncbi:DNA polymerase-3 subunit delta' [Saccharopolyspora erythraea NRRL 2338]|uniref:DNA polymerase III, delta' subunit n=2 Tax=Saccharopolyspora erythraea TaxID=1836 RepID=A4F6Q3_SACEN|nr:DNA polymerase III subunit delta' [Saccharopolyspora erythraea]EQD87268.1 DNA polymerase III subunit delta' [Saccharopolyspora erythraea D]PFG93530.1 DNA polymerase-3 subunit delta' [Saccharopolyspora erythraea NRRL 2338]QRK90386.1 DNA polymerase III subunit delta' [Saccharopolyspora erythraea]CAL99727.1 DNA polymerase III, delta' subunit [Saccharopolyspora erythraea NRRL 2338]
MDVTPELTTGVWADVVGQPEAVRTLRAAVRAADLLARGEPAPAGAMTHAWLFTGPPGSGRSVAARSFAAALQCTSGEGCGHCSACRTVQAGTHADVRVVVPEGLSISVSEMRSLVQASARRPTTGQWRVVLIEDSDRLTEGASNALLKAVEEPPDRTVFLLCAPSDHPEDVSVTIRSRCRVVQLKTPRPDAIAEVLAERDGIEPRMAQWAASVSGGHIGRARRLATDGEARERREAVLSVPLGLRRFSDVFTAAGGLVKASETDAVAANEDRNEAEKEELRTAMGAGGTGKGTAAATRGANAAIRELEKRQKSRATRSQRDALDLALVDLAGFYRDVLVVRSGSTAALNHPDFARSVSKAAAEWTSESTLRRLEAVLACRLALTQNVKPIIAVEAMAAALHRG